MASALSSIERLSPRRQIGHRCPPHSSRLSLWIARVTELKKAGDLLFGALPKSSFRMHGKHALCRSQPGNSAADAHRSRQMGHSAALRSTRTGLHASIKVHKWQ